MIPLTLEEIVRAIHGRPSEPLTAVSVTGVSTDSRTCGPGDLFFAIKGERFDGHAFADQSLERGAVAAVVERPDAGGRGRVVVVRDTLKALGRLGAFHRKQSAASVIAITGSNGKTTTKCMVDHVLSGHLTGRASPASFNNAIGVPLTLLSGCAGDSYLVVEIGSNAPGEVAALGRLSSPNIAVITSIGQAHLAGLGDAGGVAAEKLSLLPCLRPGGLGVVNADVEGIETMVKRRDGIAVVAFGTAPFADVRVSQIETSVNGVRFRINDRYDVALPVPGRHNAMNAAATFAVCRRLGLEAEQVVERLTTLGMPSGRLNVFRGDALTIIDDTYNANPTSVAAALEVLSSVRDGRRVVVLGDMLELGNQSARLHRETGRMMGESGADVLIGVGEFADEALAGARTARPSIEAIACGDSAEAVEVIRDVVAPGDTVLVKGSRRLGLERVVGALQGFEREWSAQVGS